MLGCRELQGGLTLQQPKSEMMGGESGQGRVGPRFRRDIVRSRERAKERKKEKRGEDDGENGGGVG